MDSADQQLLQDDVSLVVVILDMNPFFWTGALKDYGTAAKPFPSPILSLSNFLDHVCAFLNSILVLHRLNQVVVIATGVNTCEFLYDSSAQPSENKKAKEKGLQEILVPSTLIFQQLEEFVKKDQSLHKNKQTNDMLTLLSGSLSMALCYIQKVLKSQIAHPQPRILCLQGSPDAPQQYVAVMNAIFSAQRSMVPIDACIVGSLHSPFLQQASHITGGIYLKPQQGEGLFQCLSMVFATDLHSRRFMRLPRPTGVDFHASCFCHKKTIDMGYVCSVCLSIFCESLKKCSTCGSTFKASSIEDGS